ncbi:MAG: hypothetical protein LBV73_14975 [Paraburkholderia sp.]|nr:hypothetical protein [Paraburkholderia sp.]
MQLADTRSQNKNNLFFPLSGNKKSTRQLKAGDYPFVYVCATRNLAQSPQRAGKSFCSRMFARVLRQCTMPRALLASLVRMRKERI